MIRTIKEINEKIKLGEVVVVTVEEIIDIVEKEGVEAAAKKVDIVTTGTFGPMCSSGAYFNIGSSKPKIKLGGGSCLLNNVPAYCGFAAYDVYIGATALLKDDPKNNVYPGEFKYGGGHIIEDLVSGKDIRLSGEGYGTDCYPRKKLETLINIKDLNETVLFNIRNAYQNYNVAVNLSDKFIHTYMGTLKPNLGNANYCSAGQLSPLLKDPNYRTIGVGTRIFLGGGTGYIAWHGTQHNPNVKRKHNSVPAFPAGTIATIGDLKNMDGSWLRGVSMLGYGASLAVGIGVPIPIIDEEICRSVAVKDSDIYTQVIDYSRDYPNGVTHSIAEVNYEQLKSGTIKIKNKDVSTGALSSYSKAREICDILKQWIKDKKFYLSEAVASLPGAKDNYNLKPLKERHFK
ncbi:MAG: homocysteine biosynthesis protein [Candidatus Gygaella obscura]|nr:homocysteine biosynthesis protein [Candidatus Gygaella obscura]